MKCEHACPECGNGDFKRLELPNGLLVHWILNPGLAFNELVLGQRIPKLTLICQSCDLPLLQRQYVPCPSCESIHNARLWTGRYGFKNWLGLVCPGCANRIPCLWNIFSLLILSATVPLWFLPYRLYFRDRCVPQPTVRNNYFPDASTAWWLMGLSFGSFMWITMSLIPGIAKAVRSGASPANEILVGLLIWTIAGVCFAFFMKKYLTRKANPESD